MGTVWLIVITVAVVAGALSLFGWAMRRSDNGSPVRPGDSDLALASRAARRLRRGLILSDRWAIRWAVWRGRAVRDPRLAAATVATAVATQESIRSQLSRPRVLPLIGPILILISVLIRVSDKGFNGIDLVLTVGEVMLIVLIATAPPRLRRSAARAETAEQLNGRLLRSRQL